MLSRLKNRLASIKKASDAPFQNYNKKQFLKDYSPVIPNFPYKAFEEFIEDTIFANKDEYAEFEKRLENIKFEISCQKNYRRSDEDSEAELSLKIINLKTKKIGQIVAVPFAEYYEGDDHYSGGFDFDVSGRGVDGYRWVGKDEWERTKDLYKEFAQLVDFYNQNPDADFPKYLKQ